MKSLLWLPVLVFSGHASALGQAIPEADRGESIQTTHKLAECIVVSRPKQASALFAAPPGSADEAARLLRLRTDAADCLDLVIGVRQPWDVVILSFRPPVIRGPVAEALLKWISQGSARKREALAPPFDMTEIASASRTTAMTRAWLVVLDFADCVYRSAPTDAAALFATKPASEAEKQVVDRISPLLGSCLAAGAKFTMNLFQFRGALAEAAYRNATSATLSIKVGVQK